MPDHQSVHRYNAHVLTPSDFSSAFLALLVLLFARLAPGLHGEVRSFPMTSFLQFECISARVHMIVSIALIKRRLSFRVVSKHCA